MKCQRCESGKEAEFRVVSDILNIKVCADCARETQEIGMSLQIVAVAKAEQKRAASETELGGYFSRWRAAARNDHSRRKLLVLKRAIPFQI